MNYTELKTNIQEYLENDETTFTGSLDTFIKLGEARIYGVAKLPMVRKNQEGNCTASNRFLSIPDDVKRILGLKVEDGSGNQIPLLLKDDGFIREAYPNVTTTGVPKYYSIYDDNTVVLGPTPDSNYTMFLSYHGKPTSIVSATNTWLGDNYERLLLYACLVEGYIFMKGDQDMIDKYEQAYNEELEKCGLVAVRAAHGSDETRPEVA